MILSSTSRRICLLTAVLGMVAIASCGHPSTGSGGTGGSTGSGGNCTPGEELCACMAGNACNPGLACADHINQCVTIGSSSGTGGSSATGGTTGSGGTGGSPSTGGVTGTGGATATGGGTGGGGKPGSGGTTGSGGSMSTCGSMGAAGSSGTNLVMNGDLSQGDTGWNVGQGSPSSSGVMNGQYCATFNSGTVLLGWGNGSTAANLMSGASYRLSYQVSSSNGGSTSLEIHIGQAVSPYNADTGPITGCSLQSSPTTYTQVFTSMATDSTAGIAFLFTTNSNTTVCVDNVTLTQN